MVSLYNGTFSFLLFLLLAFSFFFSPLLFSFVLGNPGQYTRKSPDSCSVFVFASSTSALHSSLSFLALASHTSTATANQWEHRNDDNIGLMAVSLCDNMTHGRTNSFSSCYGHSWWLWRGNWRSVDVLLRPAQHVCYQSPAVHKFVFCVFYCVFDCLAARCSEIKFIYIKWYRRRTLNEPRLAHAQSYGWKIHDKKNTDLVGLGLVSPRSTSATCIPTIVRRYAETNYQLRPT